MDEDLGKLRRLAAAGDAFDKARLRRAELRSRPDAPGELIVWYSWHQSGAWDSGKFRLVLQMAHAQFHVGYRLRASCELTTSLVRWAREWTPIHLGPCYKMQMFQITMSLEILSLGHIDAQRLALEHLHPEAQKWMREHVCG